MQAAEPVNGSTSSFSLTNTLTREEEEMGWRLLFNGKDMSGWRLRDSATTPTGWIVNDTSMAFSGRGPNHILSTEIFGDFELTMDWMVGMGADAGLFLRVWDEKDDPSHVAPEVQLVDNRWNSQAMEPKKSAGACTHLYAPTRDATNPLGQFNHLRVVAMGGKVTHWMNGAKVVEYEIGSEDWKSRLARSPLMPYPDLGSSRRGYLGLQQNSTTARFRNLKLRPLGMAIAVLPRNASRSGAGRLGAVPWMGLAVTEKWGVRDFKGRSIRITAIGK